MKNFILFLVLILSNQINAESPPENLISKVSYFVTEDMRYWLSPCDFGNDLELMKPEDYVIYNSSSVTKKVEKFYNLESNSYNMTITIIDSKNTFPDWSVIPHKFVYSGTGVEIFDSKMNLIADYLYSEKQARYKSKISRNVPDITSKYNSSTSVTNQQIDLLVRSGFKHFQNGEDIHLLNKDDIRISFDNNTMTSEKFNKGVVVDKKKQSLITVDGYSVPKLRIIERQYNDRLDRSVSEIIRQTFFGYHIETSNSNTGNRSVYKNWKEENVVVSPVPSYGIVSLTTPIEIPTNEIVVSDLTGQILPIKIMKLSPTNYELNMESYSNGVYLVSMKLDNSQITKKLIIQK